MFFKSSVPPTTLLHLRSGRNGAIVCSDCVDLIKDNEAAIETAIDADFAGRPRTETQISEIFPSLLEIRGAIKHGKRWMKPRSAGVSKWFLPARANVVPRPLGVVGIIVPWNYPLFLAASPLVAALVAGNRAMVKMSEFTPAFSELFQQLIANAFRTNEVAVITGDAEVSDPIFCFAVRSFAVHGLN